MGEIARLTWQSPFPHARDHKMGTFGNRIAKLSSWLNWIAGASLVSMMALTCCDVIGRLFRFPILGTYEIVGFLGTAAASLATAYTTVQRGHVSVSLIVLRLPPRVQFIVFIITHLLSMMLFAFLTVECVRYGNELKSSGEMSMTLEWPMHPLLYGMSFSFLIVCAVLWVEFYDVLAKRKRPWS
jgi:TRAP-type C4-dicarboxylate transport system permease small subunit